MMTDELMDARDSEILATRYAARAAQNGPRLGDYVLLNSGAYVRICHDYESWDMDLIQTTYGGSYYLGEGYVSYSGGLDPGIPKSKLVPTPETRMGGFWFFRRDYPRAHNGLDVHLPCRVYAYDDTGEEA